MLLPGRHKNRCIHGPVLLRKTQLQPNMSSKPENQTHKESSWLWMVFCIVEASGVDKQPRGRLQRDRGSNTALVSCGPPRAE